MQSVLRITIRFLNPVPTFHGQRDGGEPEWPPSPLRLFQALVDAAANRWRERQFDKYAQPLMKWLERLGQPEIVAPVQVVGAPFRIAVPNNDLDVWAGPISKGNEPKKQPNELKTMKQVHPVHLRGDAVHYLYPLPKEDSNWQSSVDTLTAAACSITHLGWGIDMAVGDAGIITEEQAAQLSGQRWRPSPAGGTPLRTPRAGTLDDLMRKHTEFLNRVTDDGFRPVPPLRVFDVVRYRRHDQPLQRPYRVFELRDIDGSRFRYPHRKLIHIAGMVRHLAINAMATAGLPRGVENDWVETYVAGHRKGRKADLKHDHKCRGSISDTAAQNEAASAKQREAFDGSDEHRQLSYIPLPSVGKEYVDPGIRRVMIVAPVGDDALLDYVARRLGGQQLKAHNEKSPEFGLDENGQPKPGPLLVPMPRSGDGVTRRYTAQANTWHSFTPVILPGHDDRKPAKTRRLIEKALIQSGIDQPCEFEWSAFSRFPKSYSAQKYVRDESAPDGKRRIGYIRPDHLLNLTAVHLRLTFDHQVAGPLTIGAGRHCGFGLMAGVDP